MLYPWRAMARHAHMACLLGLLSPVWAQNNGTSIPPSSGDGSSTTSTTVARGTPVPAAYNGPLRPRSHFSPPRGFMNDPNGLFINNGTYHYYYQYNPTATVAGNQHWGHATSSDGYTWINQPIALFPPDNETFVFSGSAVVDVNNTSGFFPDQNNGVVAIYTLANYPGGAQGIQRQAIAYSRDGGFTFTPYESNPVLDANSTNFRDPKVTWYAATQRWVMSVAFAAEFVIAIYTSPNLKDWTFASNFSHAGLLGIQYECPNLVAIPYVSTTNTADPEILPNHLLYLSINPGAPLGGSVGQYFPGRFNGTHFTAFDAAARISDFAKDNYAGQFFFTSQESTSISIDWASNWQYTNLVPTGPSEGWQSAATVPRDTYLTSLPNKSGFQLVRYPHNIQTNFECELLYNKTAANTSVALSFASLPSQALWFEANITGLAKDTTSTAAAALKGSLNLTFTSSSSGETVRLGTNVGAEVWMTRRGTLGGRGFGDDNPFYTDSFSASGVYGRDGTWRLAGVLDRSLLELFLNGGQQVGTMVFYPTRPLDTVVLASAGLPAGAQVSVGIWGLKDTWAGQAVDGVVRGNVSSAGSAGQMEMF